MFQFHERLKLARNTKKISQKELAKQLYISQQAYAKYETGASTPSPDTLSEIASVLGVSVDYLLGRDDAIAAGRPDPTRPGSQWVPVLGSVNAGVPIEAVEEILDYEEIDAKTSSQGEHFALKVKGDSMAPRILAGDVVIVRQQSSVDTGDVAVVLVNGDEATVKRIKIRPDGLMLIPNNSNYEPMFYTNEDIKNLPVVILGKVVELRGKA